MGESSPPTQAIKILIFLISFFFIAQFSCIVIFETI